MGETEATPDDVGGPTAPTEPASSQQAPSPDRTVREYRGSGIMWGAIALVVVLAAFVSMVIQNGHSVDFDFLWLSVSTPLNLVIAVAVAAGLAVGEVVGFIWRRRRRSNLQQREELRQLKSRR